MPSVENGARSGGLTGARRAALIGSGVRRGERGQRGRCSGCDEAGKDTMPGSRVGWTPSVLGIQAANAGRWTNVYPTLSCADCAAASPTKRRRSGGGVAALGGHLRLPRHLGSHGARNSGPKYGADDVSVLATVAGSYTCMLLR